MNNRASLVERRAVDQYLLLGLLILGVLFASGSFVASALLAPRKRPTDAKSAPYECGIVPEIEPPQRFPVRFYLVAMIFVIFDIEIVFMYPFAVVFRQLGAFGLVEVLIFSGVVFAACCSSSPKGPFRGVRSSASPRRAPARHEPSSDHRSHLRRSGAGRLMALEDLPHNFLTGRVEDLVKWARRASVWPASFGLACCAIEMMAAGAADFDLARFGMEVFRNSPRQADLMIVAGRVSQKMAPVLRQVYDQMMEPKWVISMGVCASSGGMFNNYAIVQGVDQIVPVDVYAPGCPPSPETLMHAILTLHEQIRTGEIMRRRSAGCRAPSSTARSPGRPNRPSPFDWARRS
jgi:NADH-quinone oxidoreductase subunit B